MKFLDKGTNVKVLEKDVKNKWRWEWLEEIDESGQKYEKWLKNRTYTVCFVIPAERQSVFNYKSSGKKAVKSHSTNNMHKRNVVIIKTNQVQLIMGHRAIYSTNRIIWDFRNGHQNTEMDYLYKLHHIDFVLNCAFQTRFQFSHWATFYSKLL